MEPIWANYTLVVALSYAATYTVNSEDEKGTPYGLHAGVFTAIVDSMKLQWERMPEKLQDWGQCFENRTCVGQAGKVLEGKADLAMGPLVFSTAMFEMLRAGRPTLYMDFVIVNGFPVPFKPPGIFAFVKIFSPLVWLLLGICVGVLPLFSWKVASSLSYEIKISVMDHYQAFVENLSMETPRAFFRSTSLRFLFCGWLLSSSVICFFLNATFKSFMTFKDNANRIDSVYDLLERNPSQYKLRVLDSTGTFDMLKNADFPTLNRLAEYVVASKGLTPMSQFGSDEILREMEQGKGGMVLPCALVPGDFYNPPSKAKGYLYCSKEKVLMNLLGWLTPKNASPIVKAIADEMDRRQLWFEQSPSRLFPSYILDPDMEAFVRPGKVPSQSDNKALTLEATYGGLILGIIGIGSGFISLICEIAFHTFKTWYDKR